jgi:hypothetical protein
MLYIAYLVLGLSFINLIRMVFFSISSDFFDIKNLNKEDKYCSRCGHKVKLETKTVKDSYSSPTYYQDGSCDCHGMIYTQDGSWV